MFSLLSYGEVLVDFLPSDNGSGYYPLAGGAPANVAVAYAKLGGTSYFAGGISLDNFGEMLFNQLEGTHVKTDYISKIEQSNTALVLVSLDSGGERSFNFYRDNTADTLYDKESLEKVCWQDVDIFHFCSNTLTNNEMNSCTLLGAGNAKSHNKLVSFDVNLRQQLWSDLTLLPERVQKCIELSDVVKFSKEEAEYLAEQAQLSYQAYLNKLLLCDLSLILITDGPNAVHIISNNFSQYIKVPNIKAVDTTAAGDSFISSFLFSLGKKTVSPSLFDSLNNLEIVTESVTFATKCSALTCLTRGAFTALPTIHEV